MVPIGNFVMLVGSQPMLHCKHNYVVPKASEFGSLYPLLGCCFRCLPLSKNQFCSLCNGGFKEEENPIFFFWTVALPLRNFDLKNDSKARQTAKNEDRRSNTCFPKTDYNMDMKLLTTMFLVMRIIQKRIALH